MTRTLLISGPIGSGKSTASVFLEELGLPVFNCDREAAGAYADPALSPLLQQIAGIPLFTREGQLDRAALAERLFSCPERLREAEALIHPWTLERFSAWKAARSGLDWVGIESALLLQHPFPAGFEPDAVLYIDARGSLRAERASGRQGVRWEQRAALQPDCSRDPRITRTLCNNGGKDALKQEITDYYQQLISTTR